MPGAGLRGSIRRRKNNNVQFDNIVESVSYLPCSASPLVAVTLPHSYLCVDSSIIRINIEIKYESCKVLPIGNMQHGLHMLGGVSLLYDLYSLDQIVV